jgi:hypothetical protein
MSSEPPIRNHAAFIWSVADKLRGVYKQSHDSETEKLSRIVDVVNERYGLDLATP